MKKFMNFRLALCLMLAMMVSTIFASYVFVTQNLKLALVVILAGFLLIFLIMFAVFKKRILCILSAVSLVAIIPAVSICCKSKALENNKALINETNNFSGKIYKFSEDLDRNRINLYLTDVMFEESEDFHGNIYVILNADGVETSKLEIGRFVKISNAKVSALTLNDGMDSRDRSFISKDISATSYVFSYNVYFEDKVSKSVRDKIKNKVYESFKDTDAFFTDIGYAMLFGESSILDDEIYAVFKYAGVAHLLAVSGFHVSVIVAFLSFVLDKLKTNKHLKFGIVAVLLLSYAYLCSFSVSVIRASIMSLLYLYASNRNKEYDRLSALSLAGVFILFANPMSLFNLSFIFSFVSILSIILLAPIFERFFSLFFGKRLSESSSVSLAICFGIIAFQLCYFGYYPVLSFFSNLGTIPVVSVLFIYLIISVILGPIFHLSKLLISGFGFVMKYVVQFNAFIAKHGLYLTAENVGVIVLVASLLLMFVVSDYVFAKKEIKICISGVLVSLLVALMIWAKWTRQK